MLGTLWLELLLSQQGSCKSQISELMRNTRGSAPSKVRNCWKNSHETLRKKGSKETYRRAIRPAIRQEYGRPWCWLWEQTRGQRSLPSGQIPCGNFKTGIGKIYCTARKMPYHKAREKSTWAECHSMLVGSLPFRYETQTWMDHRFFFPGPTIQLYYRQKPKSKGKSILNKPWACRKFWILSMTEKTERYIQRKIKRFLARYMPLIPECGR